MVNWLIILLGLYTLYQQIAFKKSQLMVRHAFIQYPEFLKNLMSEHPR